MVESLAEEEVDNPEANVEGSDVGMDQDQEEDDEVVDKPEAGYEAVDKRATIVAHVALATYQTTVVKEEAVGEDPLSGCSNVDPLYIVTDGLHFGL